ncbi:hypothetical protein F5883DRAFT_561866 [Diaporthe sp. PMI_573]|nr:hypothetical protein F5883DRAFT_561866 [Diaporthaceae sp. PMI_573]
MSAAENLLMLTLNVIWPRSTNSISTAAACSTRGGFLQRCPSKSRAKNLGALESRFLFRNRSKFDTWSIFQHVFAWSCLKTRFPFFSLYSAPDDTV